MTVEIREFQREDAGAVARLFKASDPAWPGGFADNTLYPAETILEDHEEEAILNVYLAWADGQVVGFGSLHPVPADKDAGYLGLLTADPQYHGRGIGRGLILTILRRCIELGFKRLNLDTWPGNFRAVPLYKKTGFQWGLESEELENYMPLLLAHPLTKPYFDSTDWYSCQKRDLSLGPDSERRDGALVYRYEWESEHGSLIAIFDQKTRKLVELRTPELAVRLSAGTDRVLAGGELAAVLRVENRAQRSLTVAAAVSGEGEVTADVLRAVALEPGSSEDIEVSVRAEGKSTGDGSVNVRLKLDEHDLELGASLKVYAPVEAALVTELPVLQPGVPLALTLNLRNRTDQDVLAQLTIERTEGLTLEPACTSLRVPALAGAAVELTVTAALPGMYQAAGTITRAGAGGGEALGTLLLELPVSAPGWVLVHTREKDVLLLTRDLEVRVRRKGAGADLRERHSGRSLGQLEAVTGPPFWPGDTAEVEFTATVEHEPGAATVRLRAEIPDCPGVRLERTVTLRADGRVRTEVSLHNGGAVPVERQLSLVSRLPDEEHESAYPVAGCVIRGAGGEPSWAPFGFGSAVPFTERWAAHRIDQWWVGMYWPDGLTVRTSNRSWNRLMLRARRATVQPGESWSSGPVELVALQGGWEAVQREWRLETGAPLTAPRVVPAAGVSADPRPAFLTGESTSLELRAWSYFPRPSAGTIQVEGNGVDASPRLFELPPLSNDQTWTGSVEVTGRADEPAAAELIVRSSLPHAVTQVSVPVYLSRPGEDVQVTTVEDGCGQLLKVDNGWLSYLVASEGLGGVVSLCERGRETLWASYPAPATRSWNYPVHGGIHPILWERDHGHSQSDLGRLYGRSFRTSTVERVDSQGLAWQGVAVEANADHEALPGVSLRVEYLTLPGSDILAVASTLASAGGAVPVEYRLHTSPEYQSELPLLLLPDQFSDSRGVEQSGMSYHGKRSVAVEYAADGRSFLVVNAGPGSVVAWAIGVDGTVLSAALKTTIPARGQAVACHYVVLAADRAQAARFAELADHPLLAE